MPCTLQIHLFRTDRRILERANGPRTLRDLHIRFHTINDGGVDPFRSNDSLFQRVHDKLQQEYQMNQENDYTLSFKITPENHNSSQSFNREFIETSDSGNISLANFALTMGVLTSNNNRIQDNMLIEFKVLIPIHRVEVVDRIRNIITPTQNLEECSVCMQQRVLVSNGYQCRHRFCQECINNWRRHQIASSSRHTCPTCRANANNTSPTIENLSNIMLERRLEIAVDSLRENARDITLILTEMNNNSPINIHQNISSIITNITSNIASNLNQYNNYSTVNVEHTRPLDFLVGPLHQS